MLRDRLSESLYAAQLTLDDADLEAVAESAPNSQVAGERYNAHQMTTLDS